MRTIHYSQQQNLIFNFRCHRPNIFVARYYYMLLLDMGLLPKNFKSQFLSQTQSFKTKHQEGSSFLTRQIMTQQLECIVYCFEKCILTYSPLIKYIKFKSSKQQIFRFQNNIIDIDNTIQLPVRHRIAYLKYFSFGYWSLSHFHSISLTTLSSQYANQGIYHHLHIESTHLRICSMYPLHTHSLFEF